MEKTRHALSAGDAATDLTGRVAIVTGGARGIGGAVTRLFAARGAHVVIADMMDEAGHELAAELGGNVSFEHLDVSDETGWERIVAQTVRKFGPVDVLVNCAGILIVDAITSFEKAKFERVLQVNLVGTFLAIKHAGGAMVTGGGGSIVNISSIEGLQGSTAMAAYASSKWGVRGLTKVAAVELGASGVRVNSVHPGPVNTPMINPNALPSSELTAVGLLKLMPISRVADPMEVAHACLYLASDASAMVTGAEITIDGGLTSGRMRQPANMAAL